VPSNVSNNTELWQEEYLDYRLVEKELSLAESLGFNTCRIFLQYLIWKHDRDGIIKRFDKFLDISNKKSITVIPVLFDDCAFGDPSIVDPYLGKQKDPVPGMVLSSWTPSPGHKAVIDRAVWPSLQNYLKDFINYFKEDCRVIIWDLYNEPGNMRMGNKSLPLLKSVFTWAREAGPMQPLTAGIYAWDEPIAELMQFMKLYKPDSEDLGLEELKDLNQIMIEECDIISFHRYTDFKGMQSSIKKFKAYERPVICTEWMSRPMGSRIGNDLMLFKEEKVGCYQFGLVNGKTQCQFPWWNEAGDPEPELWFHDLFYNDGTPYDKLEVESIRKNLSNKKIFTDGDYK